MLVGMETMNGKIYKSCTRIIAYLEALIFLKAFLLYSFHTGTTGFSGSSVKEPPETSNPLMKI